MFVKYRSCELILLGSLHAPTNSGFSVSLLYHSPQVFTTVKGALSSPFRHLCITSINHFIAFSCHSDFGCIANPLYSYAVQAFPLGAMHPLALCEPPRSNLHSLADEQARRLASFDYLPARNLISEYFDTKYLRSCIVTNSLPLAICHRIVLSE